MSLINQMLRDLEQRTPKNPEVAEPFKVKPAFNTKPSHARKIWLSVLTLAGIGFAWYQSQPQQTANPAQPKLATDSIPALPLPTTTAPVAVAPTTPTPTPEPAPATAPTSILPSAQISTTASPPRPSEAAGRIQTVKPLPEISEKSTDKVINPPAPAPILTKTDQPASSEQRVLSLYRQAQSSASFLIAKDALEHALVINPMYLPARTLLLQNLIKSRASDQEIGVFAENSLQLFPGNLLFIKTLAHLHVKRKEFNAAVNLLEQVNPNQVDDVTYLSLLAASYQQLLRFPEAARIYRQLTEIEPGKAENWLGLGIALDKLNQAEPAVNAYKQALNKNTLNGQVVDYINQRLSALN